jgi:hypothetical protein
LPGLEAKHEEAIGELEGHRLLEGHEQSQQGHRNQGKAEAGEAHGKGAEQQDKGGG